MVKHKSWLVLGLVVAALIGIRAALPEGLQWYVNRTLDKTPEYDGVVGDIDLSLIAGHYHINDIDIVKLSGEVPVPLFSAPLVEFSILWSGILDGALVGEMVMHQPSLNIVDSEEDDDQQTGAEGDWLRVIDELFPLRIDQVDIVDGEFHFRNFQSDPPVDVYLSDLNARLGNLTNREDLSDNMVASLNLSARAVDEGRLAVIARMNTSLEQPAFDIDARLLDVPVMRLNDFARAYANLDMEGGTLDVATELAALDGTLEGYVKPVIYDLEVFEWKGDVVEGDNPLQSLWEGAVALVSGLLENQPENQVATNVPISGSLENVETSVWAAMGSILQNAFVEAFQSTLDDTIDLDLGGDESDDNNTEGA